MMGHADKNAAEKPPTKIVGDHWSFSRLAKTESLNSALLVYFK
ncbi:hypothetical protein GRAN_3012 [Granulicella sibirica]|uniref:Uncharacterized protein n=1 Tax=Granulicella sibirica TaxID=2479048 RepID=A0A4Q0SY98_9BACT|nr:hypothetical protein GRAN_3012 [Granulicella sibirica]